MSFKQQSNKNDPKSPLPLTQINSPESFSPFYIAPPLGKQYYNDDLPPYSLILSQYYIDPLGLKQFQKFFSSYGTDLANTNYYYHLDKFFQLYTDLKYGSYDANIDKISSTVDSLIKQNVSKKISNFSILAPYLHTSSSIGTNDISGVSSDGETRISMNNNGQNNDKNDQKNEKNNENFQKNQKNDENMTSQSIFPPTSPLVTGSVFNYLTGARETLQVKTVFAQESNTFGSNLDQNGQNLGHNSGQNDQNFDQNGQITTPQPPFSPTTSSSSLISPKSMSLTSGYLIPSHLRVSVNKSHILTSSTTKLNLDNGFFSTTPLIQQQSQQQQQQQHPQQQQQQSQQQQQQSQQHQQQSQQQHPQQQQSAQQQRLSPASQQQQQQLSSIIPKVLPPRVSDNDILPLKARLCRRFRKMISFSQYWSPSIYNPLFHSLIPIQNYLIEPSNAKPISTSKIFKNFDENIQNDRLILNEFSQLIDPYTLSLKSSSIGLRCTITPHAIVFDIINQDYDPFLFKAILDQQMKGNENDIFSCQKNLQQEEKKILKI